MLPNIESGTILLSLYDFVPELLLCGAVVFMLLLRLFRGMGRTHLGGVALFFTLTALAVSVQQWLGPNGLDLTGIDPQLDIRLKGPQSPSLLFAGLVIYDQLTVYLRCFLYAFAALVIWLSLTTGIPDREDSGDFYVLLLGATLGMALMAMSQHLLMIFIAVEMASLPSFALAGFLKGRRQSSEAALKYVVYGGGAAGIMLYGISLLAGKFGTAYLPDLAYGYVTALRQSPGGFHVDPVLVLGTLFFLVGIAFKLAAVPFHFWCPDVFEGASAEVAGFLSVASKGAALALLARFVMIVGGLDPVVGGGEAISALPWMTLIRYLLPALAFFAALTATFGNLAAYRQTNLKRLLAYSTIAHAGYMMMGLCTLTPAGVEAMLFYLVAYLFMNLGAFAVVAYLRNQTKSEDLADFRGLIRRSPVMVVTLGFFLLSLLGLPPLVGFAAKFQIFATLWTEGQNYYRDGQPGLGATLIGLLIVGGINTVISAFYYIKVLKVMTLDTDLEDMEGAPAKPLREPIGAVIFAGTMALAVLVLGILWGPLDRVSREGGARFRARPGADVAQSSAVVPIQMGPGGPAPQGKGGPPKGGAPKGGAPKGKGGFPKGGDKGGKKS